MKPELKIIDNNLRTINMNGSKLEEEEHRRPPKSSLAELITDEID